MKPKKSTSDRAYYMFALKIAGDFGASIAIPVVAMAIFGQYLDDYYGTAPRYLILGFIVAALISARIIYKKAKKYGTQFDQLN